MSSFAVAVPDSPLARPLEVGEYAASAILCETGRSVLYRAQHKATGDRVILKIPRDPHPSSRQLAAYERAFELGVGAAGKCLIHHRELARWQSTLALVMDDVGAISLDHAVRPGGLPITELLRLGAAIAGALGELHAAGVIHKDIKPSNVIVHPTTGDVWLIDLGIATRLARESVRQSALGRTEGTLLYMAPEQTGRMNRCVDSRADLYSLGILLFELATGAPPFVAADPVEILHAHLARRPPSLSEVRPEIPRPLADIVSLLLEKSADARYASAFGVQHDLATCRAEWDAKGACAPFALRQRDRSPVFRIPEKLYGRADEQARLMDAFARASRGEVGFLTVSGYAGIGKTALVGEVRQPIAQQRGYFCAGKFDQFRRDLPYLALLQALSDLVRQVLTEPNERIVKYRAAVLAAVETLGGVLTAVLPDLVHLIGEQDPVPDVGPVEAQARLKRLFANFVQVFAQPGHPLVIFLDDLQWADAPSLALLEALATDRAASHLLLIGGFRDNEVPPSHPLRGSLERIASGGCPVVDLVLAPLDQGTVTAIVDDTLECGLERARPVGALVHERAGGNPFFVLELIRSLHERGAITFDATARSWAWDLASLSKIEITGNVVELLTQKLGELPRDSLDVIQTAACCGAEFDLETMVLVSGLAGRDVARALAPALEAGLVLPMDADYRLVESSSLWNEPAAFDVRYRFQHDRVQQAAHGLLDASEIAERHLRIGRILLAHAAPSDRRHRIIDIVNHLDLGVAKLESKTERLDLAALNLEAARVAHASLAFDAAAHYLATGISLLPGDAWEKATKLALALHDLAADTAMARGDMDGLDRFGDIVLERATTALDRMNIYRHKLRADVVRTRYAEAVDLALEVLKDAGVVLPRKPHPGHALWAIAMTWRAMEGRKPLELASLKPMERAEDRAILDVLTSAAPAAYFAEPDLLPLIGLKAAQLSMRLGNAPSSAYGYSICGLILCGVLGDMERGQEFGRLAESVAARFPGIDQMRAEFVVAVFIRHWKEPLRDVATRLHDVWRRSILNGDEESATYCAGVGHYNGFFSGEALGTLRARLADPADQVARSGQEHSKYGFLAWTQLFALLADTSQPEHLVGPVFDMRARLPAFERAKNGVQIALSSLASGILHVTFGRWRDAWTDLERGHVHRESIVAQVAVPGLAYLRALAGLCLLADERELPDRAAIQREVRKDRKRLGAWVAHYDGNFGHRVQLLDALQTLVDGRPEDALVKTERAIEAARAASMPFDEGLGCERAARLSERLGLTELERVYYGRAARVFERWGALGKAAHLEGEARRRLGASLLRDTTVTLTNSHSSSSDDGDGRLGTSAIDVQSLLKALRAVSREISLESLLARTMEVAMENAGADRGVLLLPSAGSWSVRFERELGQGARGDAAASVSIRTTGTPLSAFTELPHSLVEFVARTRETVVLDDAARSDRFGQDPYIQKARPRSVLSGPIVLGGALSGIVYLENRLSGGAFTADRMQLVEAVTAQAAIAMENAGLYSDLEGALKRQVELTDANRRFVPQEFLAALGKESIATVALGDSVQKEMSVLFSDMRGFTTLVEGMSPEQNIEFINQFLAEMEPAILSRGGFVDSYAGDAIMALFRGAPADALGGAVEMLRRLETYNAGRARRGQPHVRIGIGVNTGMLTLGTIGGPQRIKCGVIGDPVNLASRIESATKHYGVPLLVGESTRAGLGAGATFQLREVDRVRVLGRQTPTTLYEVYDADPAPLRERKRAAEDTWREALAAYRIGALARAEGAFERCRAQLPDDPVVALRLERCRKKRATPSETAWDDVEDLALK
jgi:predicted ATPase/class 3 adenylate cyclase